MSWREGPMLGFDLETTGTDPFTARIVTASLVYVAPDQGPVVYDWLVDPGVDIPEAATAVHGVSTYQAQTEGAAPIDVLTELRKRIVEWEGLPLVVFNAAYDLTLLNAEFARNGLDPIGDYRPVLDPFVIDKQADKYRKGKRTLTACCEQYGVDLSTAHTSAADALAAVEVLKCIVEKYPELDVGPSIIHGWTITWRAQQCASLQEYFRRTKDPETVVNGGWPTHAQEAS